MNGYQKGIHLSQGLWLRLWYGGCRLGLGAWVGVAKTRQNISSKLKEKGDYCSHIRLYLLVCDCISIMFNCNGTYIIRYYVSSKCECLTEHSTQFCKFYHRNSAIKKAQSTYLKTPKLSESAFHVITKKSIKTVTDLNILVKFLHFLISLNFSA